MTDQRPDGAFRHEALLYRGPPGFLEVLTPFIVEGLERDEPVLVMVTGDKIDALRGHLGDDASRVSFEDMAALGRNPSRIIPAWRAFFSSHARPARGIGEPIWSTRSPPELAEAQRHEHLINLAFGGAEGVLVCPYDVDSLDADVIDEAIRSHPLLDGRPTGSPPSAPAMDAALLPPPADSAEARYGEADLGSLRSDLARRAEHAGVDDARIPDLVLAVTEIVSNSIRHAGGPATVRWWGGEGSLTVEVRDPGRIADPLAGRHDPDPSGGMGLWFANQLCDLVQIRSSAAGTTVRLTVGSA